MLRFLAMMIILGPKTKPLNNKGANQSRLGDFHENPIVCQ